MVGREQPLDIALELNCRCQVEIPQGAGCCKMQLSEYLLQFNRKPRKDLSPSARVNRQFLFVPPEGVPVSLLT